MNYLSTLFFLLGISLSLWSQSFTDLSIRPLNSGYDEHNPLLSPDGTLYFTIANHPLNIGGKKDPGDIWFSNWSGKEWSTPIHGGPSLNDRGYNAATGFSSDGNQIFLVNHYSKSGSAGTQGISWARKTQAGWTFPENISIPYFINRSSLLSGQLVEELGIFITRQKRMIRKARKIFMCRE